MFTQAKNPAKIAMDKMVVVSLHTDGKGPRREEFGQWRDELTATATNPVYVVMDPFGKDKVLYKADYNDAVADNFGEHLAKAGRRFQRGMKGRKMAVTNEK